MISVARENVQSYPRPPALEPVPQRIRVRLGNLLVAETTRALRVLETHHAPTYYLPSEGIYATLLPGTGHQLLRMEGCGALFRRDLGGCDRPARGLGL